MTERTALGEAILKHWREHSPQMVRDLENANRLNQSLMETQELAGDLLYELVSVQKMEYQAAWEITLKEWGNPPSADRPKRPRSSSRISSRARRRPHRVISE